MIENGDDGIVSLFCSRGRLAGSAMSVAAVMIPRTWSSIETGRDLKISLVLIHISGLLGTRAPIFSMEAAVSTAISGLVHVAIC